MPSLEAPLDRNLLRKLLESIVCTIVSPGPADVSGDYWVEAQRRDVRCGDEEINTRDSGLPKHRDKLGEAKVGVKGQGRRVVPRALHHDT